MTFWFAAVPFDGVFVSRAVGVKSSKHRQDCGPGGSHMCSSGSVRVSDIVFGSLTGFELVFACGVR